MKILSVIPFRNNHQAASESAQQLQKAGFKKNNICLIDDCSQLQCQKIKKLSVSIKNQRNKGWAHSTNNAIAKLKPSYFIPLGAGDSLLPGSFHKLNQAIKKHPECGLFFWPIEEIAEKTKQRMSLMNCLNTICKDKVIYAEDAEFLLYGKALIGQACFKTSSWEKAGRFRPSLKWHADHFVFHMLASREPIYYFAQPMGTFLRSKSSLGTRSEGYEQIDLCKSTVKWLERPANRSKREVVIKSGALCVFEHVLSKVMQNHHSRNMYIDSKMIRWLFLKKFRGLVRHPIPKNVKEAFRKVFRTISTSKPHSPLNRN